MYHGHPSDYFAELATTRVKEKDTQDECLLFKLAAETRNEIYALVFPVGPKKDGGIELNNHSGEDALTRTCQQIYDESQKMYKRAKRIYPTYTFTINVVDRKEPLVNALALEGFDFLELTSFCVTWRADEHNKGNPLRFTSRFKKRERECHNWNVKVELHDEYWRGKEAARKVVSNYRRLGEKAMYGCFSFASGVSGAVYAGPEKDEQIWQGLWSGCQIRGSFKC
jgi:hypothetical protein